MELGRALPRTTGLPSRADDRRDGVDEREQLRCVVRVGSSKPNGQRDAVAVDGEMVLRSGLAAVDGIRADLLAPLLPRTLTESTLEWLQSMDASSPSQFSSLACNRAQTPAACQSRRRRQQVEPLPQPSSIGRSRQGQPVRSTKTIPPRARRSAMRGRPPFGLAGSFGSNGSRASQRSSAPSDEAFMTRHHATPRRFCNTL